MKTILTDGVRDLRRLRKMCRSIKKLIFFLFARKIKYLYAIRTLYQSPVFQPAQEVLQKALAPEVIFVLRNDL